MDSPVSMDSFITQLPLRRIISQGRIEFSGISIKSPGTNSSDNIVYL